MTKDVDDRQQPTSLHAAILESMHDAILIVDGDGLVEECNQAAEVMFDCDRRQLCGRAAQDLLRPESAPSLQDQLAAVEREVYERIQVGTRHNMAAVSSDGRERPVEVTVAEVATDSTRHCLIICDLTADRRAAIQAARLSILQQVVTRATTRLIATTSLDDSIAEALASIGQVLGVSHGFLYRLPGIDEAPSSTQPIVWRSEGVAADQAGVDAGMLLHDDAIRDDLRADRIVVVEDCQATEERPGDVLLSHGVRSFLLVPVMAPELNAVLGFDDTRAARRWTMDERAVLISLAQALARSIERVRTQASLDEARKRSGEALARAEKANEAKSEFLANVSHELRTPLTAIVGYADLAARNATSQGDRIEMCGRIQRSADFLLGLINDILDLSKIESRKLALSYADVDLAELVSDVSLSLGWMAQDKGIDIDVRYATDVPMRIVADPTRLRQILVNLVSNGLKFTSDGGVTITVGYQSDARKQAGRLTLQVADTGIGIRADRLPELFSKFTQVHSDCKYGGTGLGLAITRHLARLMDGDVEVESVFGEGSTFTVVIPVEVSAAVEDVGSQQPRRSDEVEQPQDIPIGTRVLVADDNADNRQIFQLVLEGVGAEVTTVENGHMALNEVQQAERRDQPFDVVLMDMSMPVLDGYDTTGVLRRQGHTVPVVALTAFSMASDREKCLAAGCDSYVTKPVRPQVLIREVAKILQVPRREPVVVDERLLELPNRNAPLAKGGDEQGAATESLFDQNPEYASLLARFRAAVAGQMADVRAAFDAEDAERVRALVHKLKGSAGCYGFMELVAQAGRCEDALRAGATLESVADVVHTIADIVERIARKDEQA